MLPFVRPVRAGFPVMLPARFVVLQQIASIRIPLPLPNDVLLAEGMLCIDLTILRSKSV
jgi:hypothetical protein